MLVLISGAGPSGLVLALTLQKNGIPVRIIDKEPCPRLGERGAGVSPRSLELHKILGTFPDIHGGAGPIPLRKEYGPMDNHNAVKIYPMLPISEPTVGVPFADYMLMGQNHQERILRSNLEALHHTKVEFGTELRAFTQTDDGVDVELIRRTSDGKEEIEQVTVPWLIGTDGAHSIVRKTLGFEFLGETQEEHDMVIGDIRIASEPREFWERWGSPKSKIFMTRNSAQDKDVLTFLTAGREVDAAALMSDPRTIIDSFYEISGRRDIVLKEVIWASKYRPNIRMVSKVRSGRVFIAGDAAHCHSPAGGQGLNSSIQDSFNLGWQLALVAKGLAPASLLDTYAEERLPVIAEMLNKTTELLNERINATPLKPAQGDEIRADMSQLGVNYRGSSIVFEEGGDPRVIQHGGYSRDSITGAQPGDRAPDAPNLETVDGPFASIFPPNQVKILKIINLYSILSPSHHTALVFGDEYSMSDLTALKLAMPKTPETHCVLVQRSQGAVPRAPVGFHQILEDVGGHAYGGYRVGERCVVIVRPDGVIGARVRTEEGVKQYFHGIYGT